MEDYEGRVTRRMTDAQQREIEVNIGEGNREEGAENEDDQQIEGHDDDDDNSDDDDDGGSQEFFDCV